MHSVMPPAPGRRTPSLDSSNIPDLDRRTWRNWLLVVGMAALTLLGLGTSVLSLMGLKDRSSWPWPKTDLALLAGLSVVTLVFAAYLTRQQRQLMALRRELELSRESAANHVVKHYERLVAVYAVNQTLASETDPQKVFDRLVHICRDTFQGDQASLMLLDGRRQTLVVRSAVGHLDEEQVRGARLKIGDGIAGWVAEHREPLVLGPEIDPSRFRGFHPEPYRPAAAMVVPVLVRDELVGVLSISSRSPELAYEEADLQALLVFAESAGACIRHTEQAEWMRKLMQQHDAAVGA